MASASGIAGRIARAWTRLPSDQKLAAGASLGLFVSMFLPWYQLTATTQKGLDSTNLSAFGDFSFIEAAVLLVAVSVLVLLFARAERRAFHLPGGDGTVLLAAGAWTTVLLVWRAFDKPDTGVATAIGLQWGFVFAFAASGMLAYAGFRVRAAHRAEPPLPGEGGATEPLAGPPPPPLTPDPETAPTVRRDPGPETAPTVRRDPGPETAPTVRRDPGPETAPTARRPPAREEAGRPDEPPQLFDDLTRAHGSEEPLPRDDLTLELSREERRQEP